MSYNIYIEDFSLEHIFECGQCFRYYKEKNGYIIIAMDKILRVRQIDNQLILSCTEEEYFNVWKKYFDLDRKYNEIKKILAGKDQYLKEAVEDKWGIRLLKQDPWEVLISFIISQNKQIPHIKKLIELLSKKYGDYIEDDELKGYYTFPKPYQLAHVTEQDLRDLKVGFRAPYILDAINKVVNKEVDLEAIYNMNFCQAKDILMSIKGVGEKVSDCILLYGYGKYESFPTDVWVKRVMNYYYFEQEEKLSNIQKFARDYFGDLAGFAQQYLFYHARDNKIGK